ncbi:carboxymuconolactone decarboxylase family protein [Porticoccaceae bacterium]|jgi:AhpD family alkylhydroperoxidase|nr:carboxymuconolactone decarboxylase family protein [Porticoccaceae bacterium]
MKLKLFTLSIVTLLFSTHLIADGHGDYDMRDAKTSNPMIALHPKANQAAAEAYYQAVEKNVFNGAIPVKHAQLAAISASIAMKCVYCIPAHTTMARAAGATDEEIKTAIAIAADVALNSSMLYGNQFDMDTFMEMFPQ